jgi:serine/threonine-protein kinase
MSELPKTENLTLESGVTETLGTLCSQFEAAWQAALQGGPPPQLASYLSGVSEKNQVIFQQVLARIDKQYQQQLQTGSAADGATITIPQAGAADTGPGQTDRTWELPQDAKPGPDQMDGTVDFQPEASPKQQSDTLPEVPAGAADPVVDPRLFRTGDWGGPEDQGDFALARGIEAVASGQWPIVPGYEIIGELGRGGMGVVYKARQKGLNRLVALKMVLAGAHAGPQQLQRFKTEAEAVAHLQHPNIVQIYDIGQHDNLPYFSLEYVDGGSLAEKVYRQPQPPRGAAHLIETLARAMHYAHEHGIIHRDLKPANVLLTKNGIPKITDFGLAKRLEEDSSQTKSGALMGTPSYMAPEQARGEVRQVGPLADVYALGAMLYELLTGRPPFQGATPMDTVMQVTRDEPVPPSRLQAQIPPDLETICLKCLQKDMPQRYANAVELAEDLRRFLSDEPILARPVGAMEKAWRWCKRNPKVAMLLGTVALLLIVMATGSTVAAIRISNEKQETERQKEKAEDEWKRAEDNAQKEMLARKDAQAKQELASQQAGVALDTVYDVAVKIDEALKDKQGMARVRNDLLGLAMGNLDKIAKNLVDSGKADRTMAAAMQRRGTFYEQMGQNDKAARAYRDALIIFDRLIKENPEEDHNKVNAAICCDDLGEVDREMDPDPAVAFKDYRRALELRQDLVTEIHTPDVSLAARQYYLAASYVKLGMLYLMDGDPAPALDCGRKALEWHQAATTSNPKDQHSRRLYTSESYYLLGVASARLNQPEAARRYLDQCLQLRKELVDAEPDNFFAKQYRQVALQGLAELESGAGRLPEALRIAQEAREELNKLHDPKASNPELLWHLSNSDYQLGTLHLALGERTPAAAAFRAALEARTTLAAADPTNMQRQVELMLARAHCGELEKAAEMAQKLSAAAPKHPNVLMAAACAYATCAAAMGQASKPALSPDQQARQKQYADAALARLDQAIKAGYRDVHALEHNLDLEPLRSLPGYKTLLTQVAKQ